MLGAMAVRRRRLARGPELVEIEVAAAGIDPRHDGVRIVQLTDVHCGAMTPRWHIRAAVDAANRAEPDLIVMTGDYVCWRRSEIPLVAEQLAGLSAAPVYAALGNHDYFAGGDEVAEALASSGYRVLRNESETVSLRGADLHVIGLDDPVTRRHDPDRAFAAVPEGGSRLALSHCPELFDELAGLGAHLVLSGHTHGGQINVAPITDHFFRRAGRRYFRAGLYRAPDRGASMYLSAGVGFSGVPLRAGHGTRAEVAVLTLRAA